VRTKEKKKNMGDRAAHLKAIIMWPVLETGFVFSRYAVKFLSCQRMSGCEEGGGEVGVVGVKTSY